MPIAYKLAEAITDFHKRGVIHRDIKPSNIILSEDDKLFLIDLSIATFGETDERGVVNEEKESLFKSNMGITLQYASPESTWPNRGLTSQTDVWGYGATAYRCCTGEYPFKGTYVDWLVRNIRRHNPEKTYLLSPKFNQLIIDCLEKKPENRPTMPEVISQLEEIV